MHPIVEKEPVSVISRVAELLPDNDSNSYTIVSDDHLIIIYLDIIGTTLI